MKPHPINRHLWLISTIIVLISVFARPSWGQADNPFGAPPTPPAGGADPFGGSSPQYDPFQGGPDPLGGTHVAPEPRPVVKEVPKSILNIEPLETPDDWKPSKAERRIEAALRTPVTVEWMEIPLTDVVEQLSKAHNIPIYIDNRGLNDYGIDPSTPITQSFDGITLRSVLDLTLREIKLTYVIKNESLIITTEKKAKDHLVTRVYTVTDLVRFGSDAEQVYNNTNRLTDLISCIVQPPSWCQVGGSATIGAQPVEGEMTLIIAQTREAHQQIAGIFKAIRKLSKVEKSADDAADSSTVSAKFKPAIPIDTPETRSADRRISTALRKHVKFEVLEEPLYDVTEKLSEAFKIPVYLDRRALDDIGIDPSTPVMCRYEGISLRSALDLMLDRFHLTHILDNESLLITTPEVAEKHLRVKIYPITDLVRLDSENGKSFPDAEKLSKMIRGTVEPETWAMVGGPSFIEVMPIRDGMTFVVSQSREGHEQIAALLQNLRKAKANNSEPFDDQVPEEVRLNQNIHRGCQPDGFYGDDKKPPAGGMF